jgi:phosphate transport system substrate-binding protein
MTDASIPSRVMTMTADSRPARGMRGPAGFVPFVFSAFILLLPACRPPGAKDAGATLTVAGSTSVQPFAEKLAEEYMTAHPGVAINVQGGGSTAGVRAAETGAAQIGMSSRHLKDSEGSLHQVTIALDGIAIIVNAANPVAGLTRAEIAAIFAGELTRWSQVGGSDQPIHFVTREEGSGTRGAFEEMVMGQREIAPRALVQDSNGAVREIVASDPNALGYISLGLVDGRVRSLSVDGVMPTHDTIVGKRYAVVRPFLFLTREEPAGAARAFVEYVIGPEGQRLLGLEGLIPVQR